MDNDIGWKCPNCTGTLIVSEDKKICPYCGSMFVIAVKKAEEVHKKNPSALELFQINVQKYSDKGMKTWKQIAGHINAGFTISQYIQLLESDLSDYDAIAMERVNQGLWNTVRNRLAEKMLPDEKLLFYKDDGIFSKGKSGMCVSNKRVYFIGEKKIKFINIREIRSLYKSPLANIWYLNCDSKFGICDIGCTNEELGIILALICTLVRDCQPMGYKIGLN